LNFSSHPRWFLIFSSRVMWLHSCNNIMGLFLGVEELKLWPMNCSHTCLELFGSVVLMN
jgi:hypothetical protein